MPTTLWTVPGSLFPTGPALMGTAESLRRRPAGARLEIHLGAVTGGRPQEARASSHSRAVHTTERKEAT